MNFNPTNIFIVSILLSALCGFSVRLILTFTKQMWANTLQHTISFIMLPVITLSITHVISGNIALALGMVGALSIIRFRSAVKDPIDIVFMFWAVSIGIANGVAAFKVSFATSIIISLVIILIKRLPLSSKPFILIIKTNLGNEKILNKTISAETKKFFLKSKNINGNQQELIFEIRIKDDIQITKKISKINGVKDVNLISSSNNVLDN